MNADDPILLERRCDARVPDLGAVCILPAEHDGEHVADVDPVVLGQQLTRLMLENEAMRIACDAVRAPMRRLLRSNRQLQAVVVALALLLVVNIGLRMMGV